MAEKDFTGYREDRALAAAYIPRTRTLSFVVDFTLAGNQVAAASDSLNLGELPKGTMVLGGGMEQIVAGTATNTLQIRVGSVALGATLAGDAAAGTMVAAVADATDLRPIQLTADTDVNLLSATAIRVAGVARAWVVIQETQHPFGIPKLAPRDTSTQLS
jgi:hypothetical protein